MTTSCRLCLGTDLNVLVDLGLQPIAHRMPLSKDESEYKHPLRLHYCSVCGFIQISEPIDPKELYLDYNYCFSSWKPQPHMADEVELLRGIGGSFFEVGANDGTFLALLRDAGFDYVAGVEPNPHARAIALQRGLTVHGGFLNEDLCESISSSGRFRIVGARQVLEHISDIQQYFRCVDILLEEDGFLFLELPDISAALGMGDCSVIWEEHVNYFTAELAEEMVRRFGYAPITTRAINFSGGGSYLLAQKTGHPEITFRPDSRISELVQFPTKVHQYRERLQTRLREEISHGATIILYGVGCRACTAVNGLGLAEHIDFAVDDQVERQGKYMPGSKLRVEPPTKIGDASGKVVCLLAVNQENEQLVKSRVQTLRQTETRFLSLCSPSDIWADLDRVAEVVPATA